MKTPIAFLFLILFVTSAFAGWSDWAKIPKGTIVGEPSVVITNNGAINVMARGTDDALWWTRSVDGGKVWNPWTKVGGVLTSSPSCMQPLPNMLECYVRNSQNGVSQINRDNYGYWGNWADIGGILFSNVSAIAPAEDQRRLYGVATDGNIAHKGWSQAYGGWRSWFPSAVNPGKNAQVGGCGSYSGNSVATAKGSYTNFNYACVIRRANGSFVMMHGEGEPYDSGFNEKTSIITSPGAQNIGISEGSSFAPQVLLRSSKNGPLADVFVVANDKQMKYATYIVGSGWTTSFETIGNGAFTSGPSCARGLGKSKVNTACAGRGGDGAVWISFRRPDDEPSAKGPAFATGKVLFNAGDAGTDINKMYSRPSAGVGSTLKLKASDATKCVGGSCYFNLGVLLVRQNAAGTASVEVLMTGSGKLQNGKPVVFASQATFAKGVKTTAASVNVELDVGATTPVAVKLVQVGGKFTDAKDFETFVINVAVAK